MSTRRRPVPQLPDDLLADVLSLLPVNNLMRLKCACKSWNSMIRSKQFIKQHLESAAADSNSQRVLITLSESVAVNEEEDEQVINVNCDLDLDSFEDVDISRSCNGLFYLTCLDDTVGERHFLWNPSTGEIKEFSGKYSIDSSSKAYYGFGYDASSDDYKIVRVFPDRMKKTGAPNAGTDSSSDGLVRKIEVEVIALKSNSWRRVEDYHSRTDFSVAEEGVYSNGVLHWLGRRTGESGSVIVSFNLHTESFEELEVKEKKIPRHVETYSMCLSYVGGTSCICAEYGVDENEYMEIWGLKKNGGKASWTRLVSIPYDSEETPFFILLPICFTKNGEILMNKDGYDVVMYNPKDGSFRYRFEDHTEGKTMRLYVESLVSPNDVIGEARN